MYNTNDNLLLMLIKTNNFKKNINETINQKEQLPITTTKIPKKLNPEKEIWEDLGFTFTNNNDNNTLYNTTLPTGWSIQPTNHSMILNIIDEHNQIRGNILCNTNTSIYLNTRYRICVNYVGKGYNTIEIYFGNEEEKLFIAGLVHKKNCTDRLEIVKAYEEQIRLTRLAQEWAEYNYPDYEDVRAYWNEPTYTKVRTMSN